MRINRVDISSSYIPDIISPMGMLMIFSSVELSKRYMLRTKSNNWLKMHGYPMRRSKSLRLRA